MRLLNHSRNYEHDLDDYEQRALHGWLHHCPTQMSSQQCKGRY
jgi:hypothetical protein